MSALTFRLIANFGRLGTVRVSTNSGSSHASGHDFSGTASAMQMISFRQSQWCLLSGGPLRGSEVFVEVLESRDGNSNKGAHQSLAS